MKKRFFGFYGSLVFLVVGAALGDTHTWKGGIGSWDDETQWTNGVPLAGGDVIVAKGTVTLASASADLASFEMKGGMLVFTGLEARVSALEVAITNGTVTHVANSAIATNIDGTWDVDGRVYFSCSNFSLKAPGIVNVDARGYRSVGTWSKGYGRGGGGGGVAIGSKGAGGGGHGSAGIRADGGGLGGAANGDAWNPGPGSAGGSGSTSGGGGFGGGLVRIEASNGTVTLNGTITANGGNATGRGGGGSGGGVYIGCRVMAGLNGLVQANAGEFNSNGGPGGSGRIAIEYDLAAQAAAPKHRVRFTLKRAVNPNATYGYSDIGTLAISDQSLFDGAWIPHTGALISPAFSNWTVSTLAVSNGWLRFPVPPATFALTVTNTLSIEGSEGRLQIYRPEIQCGSLTLTSSASLYLYPKATNGTTEDPDFGGIVVVSNTLSLATNCWIYPNAVSTNGGGMLFRVGSMEVAPAAGINANTLGFMRAWRDTNTYAAYGPGRGASVNGSGSGAGHGGRGGRSLDTATRGVVYGDPLRPMIPGSGGGTKNNNASAGGLGGGLLRIESYGHVKLDGTLTADGQDGQNYGGGGSGGSIFVKCSAFSGAASGRLSAEGGARDQTGDGGGGGGRIAVWSGPWATGEITAERLVDNGTNAPATFSGACRVLPGASYTNDAEAGTVRFVQVLRELASGCVILVR